jgi:dihydroorotase
MPLEKFDGLELPATADFHVHLRDNEMMELVTPTIRNGGVNLVFVMVCNIKLIYDHILTSFM